MWNVDNQDQEVSMEYAYVIRPNNMAPGQPPTQPLTDSKPRIRSGQQMRWSPSPCRSHVLCPAHVQVQSLPRREADLIADTRGQGIEGLKIKGGGGEERLFRPSMLPMWHQAKFPLG